MLWVSDTIRDRYASGPGSNGRRCPVSARWRQLCGGFVCWRILWVGCALVLGCGSCAKGVRWCAHTCLTGASVGLQAAGHQPC